MRRVLGEVVKLGWDLHWFSKAVFEDRLRYNKVSETPGT
jgi:hypothetical protein